MCFKDFINFKQCSQESVEITQNFRNRLTFEVADIHVITTDFLTIHRLFSAG